MKDNDSKHISKSLKYWFQSNKTQVMDWPAQLPDLNPIKKTYGLILKKQHLNKNL